MRTFSSTSPAHTEAAFWRVEQSMAVQIERACGLEALGIVRSGRVHWNLGPAGLYEEAIRRGEGILAAEGPLVCRTGQHTGRSPNDKFVVRETSSERHVHWGGVNRPIEEANFDLLHRDMVAYLQDKDPTHDCR